MQGRRRKGPPHLPKPASRRMRTTGTGCPDDGAADEPARSGRSGRDAPLDGHLCGVIPAQLPTEGLGLVHGVHSELGGLDARPPTPGRLSHPEQMARALQQKGNARARARRAPGGHVVGVMKDLRARPRATGPGPPRRHPRGPIPPRGGGVNRACEYWCPGANPLSAARPGPLAPPIGGAIRPNSQRFAHKLSSPGWFPPHSVLS